MQLRPSRRRRVHALPSYPWLMMLHIAFPLRERLQGKLQPRLVLVHGAPFEERSCRQGA